ncbi:hypothetical protein SOVF_169040 [Spinacia oleracea]|nr:hypothetical protein SOVF_169040 [Spinacia oleracea]
MDVVQMLQRQFIDYMKSLYMERYLDDQFNQLQKLADETSVHIGSKTNASSFKLIARTKIVMGVSLVCKSCSRNILF